MYQDWKKARAKTDAQDQVEAWWKEVEAEKERIFWDDPVAGSPDFTPAEDAAFDEALESWEAEQRSAEDRMVSEMA